MTNSNDRLVSVRTNIKAQLDEANVQLIEAAEYISRTLEGTDETDLNLAIRNRTNSLDARNLLRRINTILNESESAGYIVANLICMDKENKVDGVTLGVIMNLLD